MPRPRSWPLVFSHQFDLRKTYWLIAGIAGIDPKHGTVGSAAWARYLVSWGIQWELDAREKPKDWPCGFTGINTRGPTEKPPLDYGTEVFQLNEALVTRAFELSRGVKLADSDAAKLARAAYPPPASLPPVGDPLRHASPPTPGGAAPSSASAPRPGPGC